VTAVVIDTNVGVVANGKHDKAGEDCISAATQALSESRKGLILIDDGQRILGEYRQRLSPSGQPGPGDAFFKWLWDNQSNSKHCRQIPITSVHGSDTDFREFPGDRKLSRFDRSDRKFVAVALGSGMSPEILNASDTDWWKFRHPLENNGIRVRFLCPELMPSLA